MTMMPKATVIPNSLIKDICEPQLGPDVTNVILTYYHQLHLKDRMTRLNAQIQNTVQLTLVVDDLYLGSFTKWLLLPKCVLRYLLRKFFPRLMGNIVTELGAKTYLDLRGDVTIIPCLFDYGTIASTHMSDIMQRWRFVRSLARYCIARGTRFGPQQTLPRWAFASEPAIEYFHP